MSDIRHRILVVEDEELLRSNIETMLTNKGYLVAGAGNGEQALEVLDRQSFDLVITDIRMERIGGIELLTRVSAEHPGTGVILMTAFTSETQRYDILRRGGLRYLEKPFTLEYMASTVEEILSSRESNGFQATLSQIRLAELIQLHCLNRATGRLLARSGDRRGEVFLVNGRFVHAHVGELQGQEALIEQLRWPGGACVFDRDMKSPMRTFADLPSDYVLLDSLRQLDEKLAHQKETDGAGESVAGDSSFESILLSCKEIARALDIFNLEGERVVSPVPASATPDPSAESDEDQELRDLLSDFAAQCEVEYAAVVDADGAALAWTDDGFLEHEAIFRQMILRAQGVMSSGEGREIDVIETVLDDCKLVVLRLNVGYLGCRVPATETLSRLLAFFQDPAPIAV